MSLAFEAEATRALGLHALSSSAFKACFYQHWWSFLWSLRVKWSSDKWFEEIDHVVESIACGEGGAGRIGPRRGRSHWIIKLVSNFFLTLSFYSFFLGLGLTTLQSSLLTHKSSNNQNCQGSIKILWRCFSSDKVLGFFFKLSRFFVGFWKHF